MKYIKLFEGFNNTDYPFAIPELYEIPSGLNKDHMFMVFARNDGDNSFYFLVDYPKLEYLYNIANLIGVDSSIYKYAYRSIKDGNPVPLEDYKTTHLLEFEIIASSPKFGPPVDVLFSFDDNYTLYDRIKDMVDGKGGLEFYENEFGFTTIFDENRESDFSETVYDEDTDIEDYEEGNMIDQEDFYVSFPSINMGAYFPFSGHGNDGNIILDLEDVIDNLTGEMEFEHLNIEDIGGREGLDTIMKVLIDSNVPASIIKRVQDSIMNND